MSEIDRSKRLKVGGVKTILPRTDNSSILSRSLTSMTVHNRRIVHYGPYWDSELQMRSHTAFVIRMGQLTLQQGPQSRPRCQCNVNAMSLTRKKYQKSVTTSGLSEPVEYRLTADNG